jgi:purine-binding chemotaxis protein CheW
MLEMARGGPAVLSEIAQFLVFRLGERRYALPLAVVEQVVRAVDVTPLPKAPPIVLGAINVHGRVLPVLNVRRRFLMPDREIGPADWFLLAHTARRTVVLVVDESEGVVERPQAEIVLSAQIHPGLEPFPGVLRLDDGLVLIHDLERFLSSDEARALDEAMEEASGIPQP